MVAGLKDCLPYVSDRKSGRRFLEDTGAEISVIPATGLKTRISASSQHLLAANGSSIQTYGKHNLNLRLRTGDYHLRTGDYRLRTGDYCLRTGDYCLRTGDYCLRTGDYRLRTGDYRLRTGDYRLRTGDYRLRTGDYRLRTGDYCLRTGDYCLRTGDYCLRTGDYRLRTGDYRLRTGDYRLRTGDYRLRTGDYRLRTGDYRLRTGDYRLRTGDYCLRTGDYCLRTGDYRLRTGDYRLRTGDYRLRTGDYRLRTGDYCLRTGDYRLRTGDYCLRTGDYRWDFVVAEVTRPLLEADFLRAHSLLVDINTKQLIDANTFSSTPLIHTSLLVPHLGSITNPTDKYASLLAKFPAITNPHFTQVAPKHGVEHFIPTQGPPVHARARRLPPDRLVIAKAEFHNMQALGIIRPSSSPWASPLTWYPSPQVG